MEREYLMKTYICFLEECDRIQAAAGIYLVPQAWREISSTYN